jgi:hypothetical protein
MKETLDKIKLREISQLKYRIKELEIQKSEKQKLWNYDRPWKEYLALTEKEDEEISKLSRRLRLIKPYEVTDIPDHGDVMTLNQFKNICRNGGFIDYDGFGHYLDGDKMTDIIILPSDVKHKSLRHELNRIIWFNR